jgi:solute carrier family 25 citrate transporter 1
MSFLFVYSMQMMRQGANSAVRFTTYSTLKQFVQGAARPGQTLPSTITFGIGAIAGLVTVYTTMPLELVNQHSSLRRR